MKKVNMKTFIATVMLGMIITQGVNAKVQVQNMPNLSGINGGINSGCHFSVSSTQIDYGEMSRWQLQDVSNGRTVTPGKRTLTLTAVCPFSQKIRLAVRGNRSSHGEIRYGDRGWISLNIVDAQLDGKSVQMSGITADNQIKGLTNKLIPGEYFAATLNGQFARGKSFTARLEITPEIPETAARVASQQSSEAALTIELLN